MKMRRRESLAVVQPEVFPFAEQLVDNPDQLARYDQAKWNLLGHADREMRFQGHQPRPKLIGNDNTERTYSIPVFAGYSEETESVLSIRKDPWTHQNDPDSWLVVEHNLVTGNYVTPGILSSSVDAAHQLWLQLAPQNLANWPVGKHPALHARRADQLRITGNLDGDYHLATAEFRAGLGGGAVDYKDIEALESMIKLVQRVRQASEEALHAIREPELLLGPRGVAYAAALDMAS